MKSILLLVVVLFFVISPVHGQLLSDATGFLNRLDIETSGHIFEIELVSNFDLSDYSFEKEQKQLTIYFDSGLENNLAEIIIPKNLLSGDFTFYLNDQEFFPKIESNEKIHFITFEFTGLGSNVIKIIGTEYLTGMDGVIPIENESSNPDDSDFLPPGKKLETTSNDYLIWIIVGVTVVIIAVFGIMKILKKKN